MIIDWLFKTLLDLLAAGLGAAPAFPGLPTTLGGVPYLWGVLKGFDGVMPVSTIGAVLAFGLAVRLSLLGVRIVAWIYEHVPFVG
jgi:hypothetical protein